MIKVAIVGCGKLGSAHAASFSKVPGIRLVAVCDPVEEAAVRLRDAAAPDARTATDPADVLADDAIDAVWVTTPNDSHRDLALQAIAAGKHVLLEKPMARTIAECEEIVTAARTASSVLMCGYKLRLFPMVEKARELVSDPIAVQVQVLDGRWPDNGWVNDPANGGGNIAAQGCHGTDLARFLARRDPRAVYGVGGRFYSDRVPTNVSAVYRFDDDIAATVVIGDADTPPGTSKFFAQIVGDGCSATLSRRLTELTYHRTGAEPEVFRGPEVPWEVENAAFVEAIRSGGPSPIDALDGWYATAMTELAVRSATTGEVQQILRPDPSTKIGALP